VPFYLLLIELYKEAQNIPLVERLLSEGNNAQKEKDFFLSIWEVQRWGIVDNPTVESLCGMVSTSPEEPAKQ
jgi:hypothetical protein